MGATTSGETVSSTPISLRDRMFAVLTANVAMAFALAGWYWAEKQVLPVNTARVLEIHILQTGLRIRTDHWNSGRMGATGPSTDPVGRRKQDITQDLKDTEQQIAALTKQIGTTAVIAYAWKYLMYLAAAFLEVAAVLSTTHRGRRAHLAAGWVVLVSTICTLVAMRLLVHPSFGGMESLSIRSYLYIVLMQGGYGVILLLAYRAGRKRPGF
ncbi:MAG: hypothetical protein QUV05_12140 [Phycisphaerae bacterium]|nr:hypothetical protein [Phycisphaerae bacterium]